MRILILISLIFVGCAKDNSKSTSSPAPSCGGKTILAQWHDTNGDGITMDFSSWALNTPYQSVDGQCTMTRQLTGNACSGTFELTSTCPDQNMSFTYDVELQGATFCDESMCSLFN